MEYQNDNLEIHTQDHEPILWLKLSEDATERASNIQLSAQQFYPVNVAPPSSYPKHQSPHIVRKCYLKQIIVTNLAKGKPHHQSVLSPNY